MTAIITPVPANREAAIADGYTFECSCGELYNNWMAASSCRKCRDYSVFGYCTHVVDISTGDVVYGEVPDYEEYERARKYAEAKWAAEKAAAELYELMLAKEGDLYSAERRRRSDVAALAARDLAEDIAYEVQDELMGY